MSPQFVFLDESSTHARWHPILSVGGVTVDADRMGTVEAGWRDAKERLGLTGRDLHYSMTWPGGPDQRMEMIEMIPALPLRQAVIALLEDFRPMRLKLTREGRSDIYVHAEGFEYVLQRLCAPQYKPADAGVHAVVFDHGNKFAELDGAYRGFHGRPWQTPWEWEFPSLREVGYSESLMAACGGPLVEIADLVVGTVTRWAACRCGVERGKQIAERDELDRACRAVLPLFPTKPNTVPLRRRGWSIVVHAGGLTGKEQLRDRLDGWIHELERDEIPF